MSDSLLKNRVAIITGGSMGIGRAIAFAFASEGVKLVLASRTASCLEDTKRELAAGGTDVTTLCVDVSHEAECRNLVELALDVYGDINILVNCAGLQRPIGFVTDILSREWLETVTVNLFGTFLCMQAVLPTMMKNSYGKIINMSGGGAVSPRARFSAYSASKAAVVRLTETIAEEVKPYHIDINAIAPGAVNTRLLEEVLQAGDAAGEEEKLKAEKQRASGGTPPEKAAELALFGHSFGTADQREGMRAFVEKRPAAFTGE